MWAWLHDFLQERFLYTPVIEDGILHLGELMLLTGPSESGKSYMALQIALELATAGSFFGHDIPNEFRVALAQAEVSEGEVQKRLARLVQGYPDLSEKMIALYNANDMKLTDGDGYRRFANFVQEVQPHVVIVDPLRAYFTGDENDSAVGEAFFSALQTAQRLTEMPWAFVGIHHVRKPSMDSFGEGKYAARGSGIWTDRPSTVLGLAANTSQNRWKLTYLKTRGRSTHPPDQELYVDSETGLFECLLDDGRATRMATILQLVPATPIQYETLRQRIVQQFGVSEREVHRWMSEAERAGIVVRERDPLNKSRKLVRRKE